jgi:ABC-type transport system involved in multi-copper enzyme maturation permease subunit
MLSFLCTRVASIMMLGLGPVMRYELITTARRGRYYLARVVYGLGLLGLLGREFADWEQFYPGGGTIEQVHQFAESAFVQFAGAQGLTLLLLVPALVAGVIADEHQRKTLHYVLASRLSSAEIVLGKLSARLLHVGIFVALGLPVVSLLGLYGGINPEYVFHVYMGTFTTVLFVAGLSILISTLARRPREAILAAYGLEACWIFGPIWIRPFAHDLRGPLFWVGPVNDWMLLSNPLVVWWELTSRASSFQWWNRIAPWFILQFHESSYWMAGLQSVFGLLFLSLAIAGLRPMRGSVWPGSHPNTDWWTRLRNKKGKTDELAITSQPKTGWWARLMERLQAFKQSRAAAAIARNELLAAQSNRPPCGDNPIRWKERYTTIGGGLRWLGGRPMVLFFSVFLGCYVFDVVYPVVTGMVRGYPDDQKRLDVNLSFRESSVALAVLGMLAVASTAAVSVTSEREQDTWTSLATTLLTPGEIVRGKQFGAVWSTRRIGLALLLLWSVGTVLGAIHPLGVLAAIWVVGLAWWFIAAIGVFISARAKNSTRALTMTFITVFIALSAWPGFLWQSLFSSYEIAIPSAYPSRVIPRITLVQDTVILAGSLTAIYGTAALVLTFWTIRRLRGNWGQE